MVRQSYKGSSLPLTCFRTTGQKMHEPFNKPFESEDGSVLLHRVSGLLDEFPAVGLIVFFFHSCIIFVTFRMICCIAKIYH